MTSRAEHPMSSLTWGAPRNASPWPGRRPAEDGPGGGRDGTRGGGSVLQLRVHSPMAQIAGGTLLLALFFLAWTLFALIVVEPEARSRAGAERSEPAVAHVEGRL